MSSSLQVVQAFHAKGIEVYMSVEYCMTGEGSDHLSGGLQGMRGLDAQTYYRWVQVSAMRYTHTRTATHRRVPAMPQGTDGIMLLM